MWWFYNSSPEPQASRTSADEEALADYIYSKVIYQAGIIKLFTFINTICVYVYI